MAIARAMPALVVLLLALACTGATSATAERNGGSEEFVSPLETEALLELDLDDESDAIDEEEARDQEQTHEDAAPDSLNTDMVSATHEIELRKRQFAELMHEADEFGRMIDDVGTEASETVDQFVQMNRAQDLKNNASLFEKAVHLLGHINTLKEMIPLHQEQEGDCHHKVEELENTLDQLQTAVHRAQTGFDGASDHVDAMKHELEEHSLCYKEKNMRMKVCTRHIHRVRREAQHVTSLIKAYESESAREENVLWSLKRERASTGSDAAKTKLDQEISEATQFIDHGRVQIQTLKPNILRLKEEGKNWIKARGVAHKARNECDKKMTLAQSELKDAKEALSTALLDKRDLEAHQRKVEAQVSKQDQVCNKLTKLIGEQQDRLASLQNQLANVRKQQ